MRLFWVERRRPAGQTPRHDDRTADFPLQADPAAHPDPGAGHPRHRLHHRWHHGRRRQLPGLARSRAVVGRAAIGAAVRDGAPLPDMSTVDAFKAALLAAKSVSFTDPSGGGTAAVFVAGMLDRLGIADTVNGKAIKFKTGREVTAAVARGDAAIGIGFISEFVPAKEVKVVGALPKEIGLVNEYSAYVPATSAAAARRIGFGIGLSSLLSVSIPGPSVVARREGKLARHQRPASAVKIFSIAVIQVRSEPVFIPSRLQTEDECPAPSWSGSVTICALRTTPPSTPPQASARPCCPSSSSTKSPGFGRSAVRPAGG